jgi:peptidoglycan/xylan/chitin deacetylase (PgdA/CDA1 family)
MRIFTLPLIFRILYPGALFRIDASSKTVYLTFDDGPVEGVTDKILSKLKDLNVKATFFCLGESISSYPATFDLLKTEQHTVANHGFSHIKGWKTGNSKYIDSVVRGSEISGSKIFRPPFGSLGFRQYHRLKRDFKIVFWDLILYDFDNAFSSEELLNVLRKKIRPGSIIVLHDNRKSSSPEILSEIVGTIREMGYQFGDLLSDI